MNEIEVPVKEGETYEVSINAVGEKGDGIARVKGFVIFVPGVKKGDYVKIKITKVLAKVGFAEVAEKLEKPAHSSKFTTISKEEMEQGRGESEAKYEDTEDFGEEE
ncbi:TRAM domain-containing protein [Candidatus Woesearchaeota archaeon]|nr:TRAM domain-containing protein [Candidatus Woesearchaeota archaeon]